MLSDNIRNYRKQNNLSQDDLAEKLGVSRQSVSFWETGQTQPTIENILALAKVFNVPTDMLLGNNNPAPSAQKPPEDMPPKKKPHMGLIIAICAAVVVVIGIVLVIIALGSNADDDGEGNTTTSHAADATASSTAVQANAGTTAPDASDFDLFTYCKNFAIEKGTLNGDYCTYQQSSDRYGGRADEYFSITYWSDSNKVELCLHCPLDETLSHNFYLSMRGGYDGKYEYVSSKYYRDTGKSLREASGYIDPSVFFDGYPIPCDEYIGDLDGQTQFMEDSRVGICDLIRCLKEFVEVEKMECDFADFGFIKF